MNADDPLPAETPATPEDESISPAALPEVRALVAQTRHDLNNLLTGILGQAQLVLMREELTPAARRRVETLEDLAKRMGETIARLNDV